VLWAQGKGKGKPKGEASANQPWFAAADREALWQYYAAPGALPPGALNLPPGLAKKLQRGKPLPPGWQKKIQALPPALDTRMSPLPGGYRRVIVDRWALVLANATNAVMDIVDLVRR
jgi:hypothetical protein